MELLYNPERMPEHAVKETFVARHDIVEELVSLIEHQPRGAGVQHAVIIAPRGMGKTTLLLMVRFAIRDSKLAKQWQTVQFPEERYNIYDLADFWIEILQHLDEITNDDELHLQIEKLKVEYPNKDELQEAALALIKDWRRKNKKRILVLVDNFDMILEQINDERDNARLRDVLMNDGTIMLIGGATTFFHEARAYDQPLYNFFKIYELPNLKFEEMQELLRRRAVLDKREDFEKTLKENKSRLRVLEHFTGGNPRLVLMLYRVVTQSDISEVRLGLEKLLDEVTPYYKSKVESLPPQQRKILDHIARVSSETNEGLTPGEIANATRMAPNQASAQLKRLVENGYVMAANLRGRSSYYTLSERLYAIWHQMRFGRNARERMGWLVSILKALYDVEEMGIQNNLLKTRFYEHLSAGRLQEARDTLEHRHYLVDAMEGLPVRVEALEGVVRSYADIGGTEFKKGELAQALQHFEKARELEPCSSEISHNCGAILGKLRRFDEAIERLDESSKLNPDRADVWYNRGVVLGELGRNQESLESVERSLEIRHDFPDALLNRGVSLVKLGRKDEALESFDRSLEVEPNNALALHNRSVTYLIKFLDQVFVNEIDAQELWNKAMLPARKTKDNELLELASEILFVVGQFGNVNLVLQLIQSSGMEEEFYPLDRAINYIKTGDEELLEKLSPEVRGIVEEIVAKLRDANGQTDKPNGNSRTRKPKSGSRRRTRKQLR